MLPEIYGQLEVDKMFIMGDGQKAFSSIAESIIPFLTVLPELTSRSFDFSKVIAEGKSLNPGNPEKPAKKTKTTTTTTTTKKEMKK